MNLDKLVIPDNIHTYFIERKSYSKYVYKIVFEVDTAKLVKSKTNRYSHTYSQYVNRMALLSELSRNITGHMQDKDYRIRSEGTRISIYTNSEADINILLDQLNSRVIGFYRPLNDAHIDIINQHTKVLVRQSLFEKKYRFKVYLKPSWLDRESRFKDVKEWLLESNLDYDVNSALFQYFYTEKSMRGIGYTAAVYFNDSQDLMMFQLRFDDKILKIEEAVLLSEL